MLARFRLRPRLTLAVAAALVLAVANPASAPPGDLDPSFDGDGRVTTDFASDIDVARAVAVQRDGKVVVAGQATASGSNGDFAVARYHPDGSLDTTFGGAGRLTTDFGSNRDVANAVVIQADGKIVVGGAATVGGVLDFGLIRYNTDGSLDSTFDGDGKVTTDFSNPDEVFGLAIQQDGQIVAAGETDTGNIGTHHNFALARYNFDGSLDLSFDIDGKQTTDFDSLGDRARAVAIQADGKIVVAGITTLQGRVFADFALARYGVNGSLDPSFDADGKATAGFGSNDEASGVAIQQDQKIVITGYATFGGSSDFALARFDDDGALDPTLMRMGS